MSDKVNMPQLAALLAEQTGMARAQCEEYLRELFSVISEALSRGENVRVSQLGTFKLVHVDERRSVDVSTGQPTVIAAHEKVVFIPSRELADITNAPFSMFDAVEVSDAVDTSDFDAIGAEPSVAPEAQSYRIDDSEVSAEACVEEDAKQPVECKEDIATAEAAGEDDRELPETAPTEEAVQPKLPVIYDNYDDVDIESIRRKRFSHGFMAGFLTALCAVAAIIWCYWYFNVNNTTAESDDVVVIEEIAVDPEAGDIGLELAAADAMLDSLRKEQENNTVAEAEKEVVTLPSDQPVYDTVSPTRYLTTIAKEHYGNYNLWPYIYEENKAILGHPDRIKPGTKVVVPPLSKYGVNPKSPTDIAEAKKLGVAIYARYK